MRSARYILAAVVLAVALGSPAAAADPPVRFYLTNNTELQLYLAVFHEEDQLELVPCWEGRVDPGESVTVAGGLCEDRTRYKMRLSTSPVLFLPPDWFGKTKRYLVGRSQNVKCDPREDDDLFTCNAMLI